MHEEIKNYSQKLESTAEKLKALELHHLDNSVEALDEAFTIAYEAQLFELHTYAPELQNDLKLELFSALTPISGSLSFLAVQILAANRIMQNANFPMAQNFYDKRCGIIINHLRAPVTIIDSTKSENGYKLSGRLTWASGYKIFDTLVVGFHHDGKEIQAVMPFMPQKGCLIGEADETFVGLSMNTVSIDLQVYEILEEQVISAHPIGYYTQQKSISKTVHFALYGIGLGAISALENAEVKAEAIKRLEAQRENFMNASSGQRMDELRIELFELVLKMIATGMVLYGGRSILTTPRLQQYYRELIMFNSNGLNNEIKDLFKSSFLKEKNARTS